MEKVYIIDDSQVIKNPTNIDVENVLKKGHGIKIIVGAGERSDMLLIWSGNSFSNINRGATHDMVVNQLGMNFDDKHVPLEKSIPIGKLRLSPIHVNFHNEEEIHTILNGNKHFKKVFGDQDIDFTWFELSWS